MKYVVGLIIVLLLLLHTYSYGATVKAEGRARATIITLTPVTDALPAAILDLTTLNTIDVFDSMAVSTRIDAIDADTVSVSVIF